jgi:signal transduction histidine kinase
VNVPRSLRVRLTLVFLAVAGPVLGASAIGTDILVRRSVWAAIDAATVEEAETIASLRPSQTPAALADAIARIAAERSPGPEKFVRVIDAHGDVRASSGHPPADLPAPQRVAVSRVVTVWAGSVPFRVADYVGADGSSYEVGVAVAREVALLRHSRAFIAAALGFLLAVIGSLAWIITGRATSELLRLAGELETIEATALDRRLVARRTAEVDRLASVLNRLLARLDAAMESLRRFTGDAAHELRTPIAALRTHVELALRESPLGGGARDHLLDVFEQVDKLGALAENLLMLNTIEASDECAERVALDRLAAEVCEDLEPIANEQGRSLTCRPEMGVAVTGVVALLRRLVSNLVDNCFRHTPPGTAIDVTVTKSGDYAVLEVADEGPGIDGAELPLVFERFHRGRRSNGTGLGLAICREIVFRYHGDITIDRNATRGTRVRVTLPAA